MSRSVGITSYNHSAVCDYDEDIYAKTAFDAAVVLNRLVNEQKHSVFMNCAAGVSRSNTVFLCYLALFGFGDEDNMFST